MTRATPIALVVSDVDGTLVTSGKILTERSRAAAARLDEAGIAFSIVSARPPLGMRMLVQPLDLRLPMGVYNGGGLVMPDLTVIEQRIVPPGTARAAVAVLRSFAVGIWAFADDRWLVENPDSFYVAREERTIQAQPTIVQNMDEHLDSIAKIVGVSGDFDRLAACETAAHQTLGTNASIVRSQLYYLDITPAGTDKGNTIAALAQRLGIPTAQIATIGDMENDVAMFRESGLSIAMGNANPEVRRHADEVTLSNDEDGFAHAIEQMILPYGRNRDWPGQG